jgi:elongation factor Ts
VLSRFHMLQAKCDEFNEMSRLLAMQIAASPNIEFVRIEDISEAERDNMKRIEMQSDDLKNKPENIKLKMIDGRMAKLFKKQVLI